MNLNLKDRNFIVCGASDGFGNAVARALLKENARVIAVARNEEKLKQLKDIKPEAVDYVSGDLTEESTLEKVKARAPKRLAGMFVNAGGPPPMTFLETEIPDWDAAYQKVFLWKIRFLKAFLPQMIEQNYGRILFLESISVKQPVENLILSNSYRLAVVGAVKTISQEVAGKGVTLNILGPGYHDTNALQRLIDKRAEVRNISKEESKSSFEKEVPVGRLGSADELASLALWLLSPVSGYITGQTIDVDGGMNRFVFG